MIEFHGNIETVHFANWAIGRDDIAELIEDAMARAHKAVPYGSEFFDEELRDALAINLQFAFDNAFEEQFEASRYDSPFCWNDGTEWEGNVIPLLTTLAALASKKIDFNLAAKLILDARVAQADNVSPS